MDGSSKVRMYVGPRGEAVQACTEEQEEAEKKIDDLASKAFFCFHGFCMKNLRQNRSVAIGNHMTGRQKLDSFLEKLYQKKVNIAQGRNWSLYQMCTCDTCHDKCVTVWALTIEKKQTAKTMKTLDLLDLYPSTY